MSEMDTDETTKASSPMPEKKSSWQILVLCLKLIATALLHRTHGKELLHFAACQVLFVPGGFAMRFLILSGRAGVPVRATPADRRHKKHRRFLPAPAWTVTKIILTKETKHLQKLEKLSSGVSPSTCCYAYTSQWLQKRSKCVTLVKFS